MSLDLTIRDLSVGPGTRRALVSVPSLDLKRGARLGIQGPSGAGKSTLLFALAGMAETCQGSVIWGGTDILALTPNAQAAFRRASLGFVFQDFLLFDELSAEGNASITGMFAPRARRTQIRRKAADTLDHLGIRTGSRDVSSLSGGERQRVAVARALAQDPAVILADEPTANLPHAAGRALARDLVETAHSDGQTLIVASHDPAVLDLMDRVLTLDHGRVVADQERPS